MNRIEAAAVEQIPNTVEGVQPLSPAIAEQPVSCFTAFAAGFGIAYAVAYTFGPHNEVETLVEGAAPDMTAGALVEARQQALRG